MPRALWVRGVLYLCFFLLISVFTSRAANKQVSLITAWPGSEIYELCGHEAIRISGPGIDTIWNYGVFNFAEPNFVYRFVKGETDYMVESYPFSLFLPEYVNRGRRVEEQVLNLTPEETERIHALLRRAATPPNNRYRYNYIKNNCSTQIADLLDSVAGGKIIYPDSVRFDTYRDAMRSYHANYPWYQFGIDVALGSGLEEELSQREELFIPVEFHRHAAKALRPDGKPLVKATNVLYPGYGDAIEGPTPFLLTPLWVSIVVAAISLLLIFIGWRKKAIPRAWYSFYFGIAGLAGCLVAFLVCISSHAATSPNLLIFWLNPLQLIIAFGIWWRPMRNAVMAMMWLNVAVVAMLLVLMPVFDRGQAGQTSFLILMATDIVLAAYYLYSTLGSNREEGGKSGGKRRTSGRTKKRTKATSKRTPNNRNTKNSKIVIKETTR